MRNKKLLYLVVIAMMFVLLPNKTMAATKTVCKIHKNYYFYNDINTDAYMQEKVPAAGDSGIEFHNLTYYPQIPANAHVNKNDRMCLSKNGVADGPSAQCEGMTWTLEQFYNADSSSKSGTLVIDSEGTHVNYYYTSKNSTDSNGNTIITTYLSHGEWWKCTDDKCSEKEKGGDNINYSGVSVSDLVKGSILPGKTTVNFDPFPATDQGSNITGGISTVHRTIKQGNMNGYTPFMLSWKSGDAAIKTSLQPALYYIEYYLDSECEEKELYNANIKYFVKDKDGSKTELTDIEYKKNNRPDGFEETVNSPEYEDCTPDKSKVQVKIQGENFYDEVVYTCSHKYTATIKYFVVDSKDNKIEILERNNLKFDDADAESPWQRTGLNDGDTDTVTSPKLNNCTPNKAKVDVLINGDNFYDEVLYTCTINNPKTSNIFVYIVAIAGVAALGYVIYYVSKNAKAKNEA